METLPRKSTQAMTPPRDRHRRGTIRRFEFQTKISQAGERMTQTAIQQVQPWERPFWKPIPAKAGIFSYLVLIHGLAVIGLVLFPVPSLRVLIVTLALTGLGGLGTTVCYHRLLAHRTFKLNKAVEHA